MLKRKQQNVFRAPPSKRGRWRKQKLRYNPIPNFDLESVIGRRDEKWVNKNALTPQNCCRVSVVGSSGTGKTNQCLVMILKEMHFDQLWIFAKTTDEVKYDWLATEIFGDVKKDWDPASGEEPPDFILSCSLNDVPDLDKIDKNKQTIIIFDDMITEKDANQEKIKELFTRGRKTNTSIYYLAQEFFKQPDLVRNNATHFMMYRPTRNNKTNAIANDMAVCGITPKQFKEMWTKAARTPRGFLFINCLETRPLLRYRNGFSKIFPELKRIPVE